MSVATVIAKRSRPTEITRLTTATRGSDGRGAAGSSLIGITKVHVQHTTDRPTELLRTISGDRSTGELRVWVTNKNVAATFLKGDGAETPIGWTGLQIAPPQDAVGPPGDRLAHIGRSWEITELQDWSLDGNYRRYIAQDRGAA